MTATVHDDLDEEERLCWLAPVVRSFEIREREERRHEGFIRIRAVLTNGDVLEAFETYGGNNRTQMLRIPAPGRVENRIVDGAANPYLACTAVLAAGLDGIERHLEPGQRNDENLYEVPEAELRQRGIGFLPTTLSEALDHLEQDPVIKEALGADYAAYYLQVKREEWQRYHQSASRWEIDNYLGVY